MGNDYQGGFEQEKWSPPFTFEERLRHFFVPPYLFIRHIAKREWYKGEKELRLLPFLVDRTRNSLDVGACWGVYTYYLAQYCPAVYAFEPNPKIYKILKRSVSKNVEVLPYALSNKLEKTQLCVPKGGRGYSNQGATLSRQKVNEFYGSVSIQARRLDDLEIDNIGFMKIDVEGFEAEVLEGAAETIKKNRPNLLIEIEEKHTKTSIEKSIENVQSYGYYAFILHRNQLKTIDHFDPQKHHRDACSREDYIFNFIFLLRGK